MKITNFKAPLLLITIISCFFACESISTIDDITPIKKEIESNIMEKINDPESYSFVEIHVIDTVYYSSLLDYHINRYDSIIESNQKYLNHDIGLEGDYRDLMNKYRLENAEYQKNKQRATLLYDEYGNKSFLNISFLYRNRNEFGALVLIDKVYEVEINNDGVEIIWSGHKDLLDECENLNYDEYEVWEVKCIPFYTGTVNNRLLKRIGEDI